MLKTITITIQGGEDSGKKFRLTRMPAFKAEKWAMRAFLALSRSGVEIPGNVQDLGMAGIARAGIEALSGIRWEDAEPLLDEMMDCVEIVCDPKTGFSRKLIDEDIEEVKTLLTIRKEVVGLHINFTEIGSLSKSGEPSPVQGKVVTPKP